MSVNTKNRTIEIARRMAQLGQPDQACKAYTLALSQLDDDPDLKLEAALYIFQNGGDYKIAYTAFVELYNHGYDQADLLDLLTGAFYTPNMKQLQTRYEKNCKLLSKYPYIFRKDFLPFGQLPIRFFPFDDDGYVPFDTTRGRFEKYVNFNEKRITHNFFRDLDQPILAHDVHSAYELHYLNDNVRKSEWVAKDNHIYLHYSSWAQFCAYLQVINVRTLLEDKKFVFLIEDELDQYPIDFKNHFGIDYSQYTVEPLHIREINRLIWHVQLSFHNGGDFFNEVFDGHPNLIAMPSLLQDEIEETLEKIKNKLKERNEMGFKVPVDGDTDKVWRLSEELGELKDVTDKDIMVFCYLVVSDLRTLDFSSRIVPAIFYQPHFGRLQYNIGTFDNGNAILVSEDYERIRDNAAVQGFKYIKTFTPMRRITTSHGGAMRYSVSTTNKKINVDGKMLYPVMNRPVVDRALNRSYLIDPQDRLYQDSILVRFEDGKLNPKATFTALCAFLDLPYTESMTYCSSAGERDPQEFSTNVRGFDPAPVYRTYDEYIGDAERYYLEYFMRDAYEAYGYDFQTYDGASVDMDKVKQLFEQMDRQNELVRESWEYSLKDIAISEPEHWRQRNITAEEWVKNTLEDRMRCIQADQLRVSEIMLGSLHFVNKNGQPLKLMPKLELDPTLLEQPLYH
jgi:hypothetical protein